AAHEDIEGAVTDLRPGMNRDVALREHGHPAHPLRRELVGVDVEERRSAGLDAVAEGLLDPVLVIEAGAVDHLDDEVGACEGLAVPADEMVLTLLREEVLNCCRLGGTAVDGHGIAAVSGLAAADRVLVG